MGRTKKLNSKITKNSKISKSKRANKKKNVRISKKKVGGGNNRRLSMTPGRLPPERVARSLILERGVRAGKTPGVKAKGFFERQIERERRERERERRERIERIARERAKIALRNLLIVMNEYKKTTPDVNVVTGLWQNFLLALRHTYTPFEIRLDYKILEHFRREVQENPTQYEKIKGFLEGPAQTSDIIPFPDLGRMKQGGMAFPTWLKEQLEGNSPFLMRTSVYLERPLLPLPPK